MTEEEKQNKKEHELLQKQALPVGTVLRNGRREYKVVNIIKAGGFGITYKVSSVVMVDNVPVKTFFALKEFFLKGCYRDGNSTRMLCAPTMKVEVEASHADFLTEAKRMNRLSGRSRNIVRVNEVFEENGTAYYVMEFLDGGDLQAIAANKGMPERQAVSLLLPIARAVKMIHENRVLHLDIKPSNIVMKTDAADGSSYPVLIDFGIAKHFDSKGRPTTKLSAKGVSEGYSPVEQYDEISMFAPEIDVYALGATLLFLLTGKCPPKSFDITPVMIEERLPNGVSPQVRSAIKSAMSRFRDERTPDVPSFIRSLGVDSCVEDSSDDTEVFRSGWADHSVFKNLNIGLSVGKLQSGFRAVLGGIVGKAANAASKLWKPLLGICACAALVYAIMLVADSFQTDSSPKPLSVDSLSAEENYVDSMAADIGVEEGTAENSDAQNRNPQVTEEKNEQVVMPDNNQRQKEAQKVREVSDDEIYTEALVSKDWNTIKGLADKGYTKAYLPLANHYLDNPSTHDLADKYAQKAKKINQSGANKIIEILDAYGYYD